MSRLTIATLSFLHRVLTEDSPAASVGGQLRSVQVWVGDPQHSVFVPPPQEELPGKLVALVDWWRSEYPLLAGGTDEQKLLGLARLHHGLVALHPFLDANGRLARLLADYGARELLQRSVGPDLTADRELYFATLRTADGGDLGPLARLIAAALTYAAAFEA